MKDPHYSSRPPVELTPEQMFDICAGLGIKPTLLPWDNMAFTFIAARHQEADAVITIHIQITTDAKSYEQYANARGVAEPFNIAGEIPHH